MKFMLWVAAVVFGYLAWKAGEMREVTGDIALFRQAIGWGIAALACVTVAVTRTATKKKKAKARS